MGKPNFIVRGEIKMNNKMKKCLSAVLAMAMMVTAFAGCGSSAPASSAAAPAAPAAPAASAAAPAAPAAPTEKYTLKMHMSIGPTDPVYTAAEQFANMVKEGTGGNVTVEIYPSSQLGNSADCIEGLSMRACDIVFESIANLASITPLANVEAMPYMYSSVDHWRSVWEGEIGEEIKASVGEACGMVIMGGGLQGLRVMTTTKPVRGLEDLKGFKLRVPTIPIYMDTWEWLGATTTPLGGSEIFSAMQQGTVEGQENGYPSSASASFHEVSDYVTETNHVYNCLTFIMDGKFFNSLPESYQATIREAAAEASITCTDLVIKQTAEKKQVFVDAGCEIITIDLAEWQKALEGFLEAKYPDLVAYADMIKAADPAK